MTAYELRISDWSSDVCSSDLRHYVSGVSVARSITSTFDADDLVQEAFSRIFQSVRRGGGPTGSFRAYLFTSIRNTAADWGRARAEIGRASGRERVCQYV